MRFLTGAGLALAVLSCGGPQNESFAGGDAGVRSPDVAPGGSPPLPCDVDAVLAANCRLCHSNPPNFAAPMPLVTYEDLHATSKPDTTVAVGASVPVFQQVGVRIHDDAHPMPQPPNARLDAASLATLDAWIANGAPPGSGSCGPLVGSDGGAPEEDSGSTSTDCVPDTLLRPVTPYTMTSPEQYVCYGVDIPAPGKRHVIEIGVHLDDKQIVHHILLLRSATSVSPTPTPCDPAPTLGDGMLYAWAPGGNPLVVPAEAGFPQDQTTHYLVQVHYNNAANVANPTDSSGFDLCTTSTLRPYDADVIAFGSEAIFLFPHATGNVTACYTAPSTYDGLHLFAAFPHMHKLGTSITTSQRSGDSGAPVDLGTDSMWDFSTQPWLPIDATIHTGDVIRTSCTWDNTTTSLVTFGQSTSNEMCYSFTAYYPSLGATYGWSTPASGSVFCP